MQRHSPANASYAVAPVFQMRRLRLCPVLRHNQKERRMSAVLLQRFLLQLVRTRPEPLTQQVMFLHPQAESIKEACRLQTPKLPPDGAARSARPLAIAAPHLSSPRIPGPKPLP